MGKQVHKEIEEVKEWMEKQVNKEIVLTSTLRMFGDQIECCYSQIIDFGRGQ